MELAFTVSTINPYTGKNLREYKASGINGFISECYQPKTATTNKWIADHCIVFCKPCHLSGKTVPQHSLFGMGKTPTEALKDCKKEFESFKCPLS